MGKLLQLALHPVEMKAALKLKFCRTPLFSIYDQSTSPYLLHCFELLNLTSRSFAAVIRELHPELRNCVTLFYLILRALDTIEDDMSIEHDLKIDLLRHFHEKLLLTKWSFDGNAPDVKDRAVLTDFESILIEFHKLKPEYQEVIKEITEKMGNGMADYILDENYNLNGLQTVHDYDVYCHYVAGLVGDGLTRLIVIAKFANESLYSNEQLYESMGLFLQKTNIIRDYNEDLVDGRSFWPKEIWSQYAPQLKDFMKPENEQLGLDCINHLVLNALSHVIDVLTYLASIHEQSTFQFCAIPQVMAIATLALVFNNREVLHGNVKIRKGTTCYLILKSRTLRGCVEIFDYYLRDIKSKLAVQDPNFLKLNIQISKIEQFMEEMYQDKLPPNVKPNETPIFLKVKERSRYDDELVPTQQEEEYKFNMVLSIILSVLLGFYYIYTLHRA
ncbi:AQG_2a_G0025650.mRNA.1.CDS.1 [Saccharomyces cerevisiae]|jgi:farnesyl-diphosphate farnesyltransferase|uniref:Squalene synthase n=8 Tax=Saccharomyces TaxID=4930 RepID=C8Z9Y9_YEAS8|nr:squalene synthetase [Saccharomyces cerevisiae]AHY77885.1 Erg9p [Saccharomyces cerevisiae YJM993]AJP39281.1 Erg9p [Saccharomyces cerevisiae YJM1078]AJU16480.1 Erg9p [Saccharomyces cerevisiae YJM1356]AJU16739.1 Erg9p [Saccharomyces cerevisiae YJM1381]AJU16999.1 Erg9p [Saccharomyces cerevisiae YJM1383]AJU17253.1 Erg9p [Saccharomyces cerevisiae YJM1385]AJU17508.1 Erg9p [Saccharomyces cerevisiae YJM1386]AJU17767.1 Erg9p [Saccharomyces cerevisiae YJM1387]AJU18027.1 Erg9p [Saccharomyces cerevi